MKEKRLKGKIKYWNGRKGFGFIAPDNGDEQIFVHIKAFMVRKGKPVIGQEVTYTLSEDDQGRSRADQVMNAEDDVATGKQSSTIIIVAIIVIAVIAVSAFLWA